VRKSEPGWPVTQSKIRASGVRRSALWRSGLIVYAIGPILDICIWECRSLPFSSTCNPLGRNSDGDFVQVFVALSIALCQRMRYGQLVCDMDFGLGFWAVVP
jgi:hypothetical protein